MLAEAMLDVDGLLSFREILILLREPSWLAISEVSNERSGYGMSRAQETSFSK